ncbi:hypothetical protein TNCV_407041, partial [Trichonephila clavipes]
NNPLCDFFNLLVTLSVKHYKDDINIP